LMADSAAAKSDCIAVQKVDGRQSGSNGNLVLEDDGMGSCNAQPGWRASRRHRLGRGLFARTVVIRGLRFGSANANRRAARANPGVKAEAVAEALLAVGIEIDRAEIDGRQCAIEIPEKALWERVHDRGARFRQEL